MTTSLSLFPSKLLAISGLWVTLCSGLGNVTFKDLKGPFKGRQQCLSGIPQSTYVLELKGRARILLHLHNYSMMQCNREQSKRSFQGWKSPVEIKCLISVAEVWSSAERTFNLFIINQTWGGRESQTWDCTHSWVTVHVCQIRKNFLPSVKENNGCDSTWCAHCVLRHHIFRKKSKNGRLEGYTQ